MTWWNYLLLVNIYLLVFYGFYSLLLRKETFFQLNRGYLVTAAILSFFIPMIQADWVRNLFITRQVQLTIYSSPLIIYQFKPIQQTQVTFGQILIVIYLTGIVFLIARLALQLVALKRVIKQPETPVAYSFFKKIKLADDHANNHVIAAHENVHASQWHSADVLLIELVMIINWFNPVVYLYRFAIKHIHEFIADRQAINCGTDKADYALLLLNQTFEAPVHRLVNPFFNHSLLKQRIMMIQKSNSKKAALIKYGLTAPLFILMLVLSSATVNNSKTVKFLSKNAEIMCKIPAMAPVEGIVIDSTNTAQRTKEIELLPPDTTHKTHGKVFTSVERVPEFQGGLQAFGNFLGKSIKYPADSRENGIQGRVIISFIVETDGSLTDIHVVRGLAKDIDQESLRVMNLSPKWKPGTQNGKPVRTQYSVPIHFTLSEDSEPAKPVENKTGAVIENKDSTIPAVTKIAINPDSAKKYAVYDAKVISTQPLYLLDGKEITMAELKFIKADKIQSISVLKDKTATGLYGPKGSNGVIEITSKDNKKNVFKSSLRDSVKN